MCRNRAAVAALMSLTAASVRAEEQPVDCSSLDYEKGKPVAVAKIISPQREVHFLKNQTDEKNCPAATPACERSAYLRPGDVVLVGRSAGAFACVSYVNAADAETNGWIASTALERRAPIAAPLLGEWLGKWRSRRGAMQADISIAREKEGFLSIKGEATYAVTRENVRSGSFSASKLAPRAPLAFVDGGAKPYERAEEGECAVRMSRIDRFLLVEDNGNCGGMGVTFTGLYHR